MEFELLLKVNFISTSVMVGVIWIIQLLHYPSFHFINDKKYEGSHKFSELEKEIKKKLK